MEKLIFEDYQSLSEALANEMYDLIVIKPNATICLASGNSPMLAYQIFVEKAKKSNLDVENITILGLDEWVGISPENNGSCHYFLQTNVFQPLMLKKSQVNLFNALATNLNNECEKMDTIINKNGIDLMVVGVGMNGHIGFNEPGVSTELNSHVIDLDEVTQSIGQKYFQEKTKISKGITIGLKQFLNAKKAILIANGEHKAEIIYKTLKNGPDESIPSTVIQKHKNGTLMVDIAAAKNILGKN